MNGKGNMLWRALPPSQYEPTGCVTTASELTLDFTLQALRPVDQMEASCLWLGKFLSNGDAIVEAVVVPKQTNHELNFSILPGAMQEVATVASPKEWTLVASVHSHPGESVEHSTYDDQMVPSRKALSLVFEMYGMLQKKWPAGVGVHEFILDYWHLLPADDSEKRIIFSSDITCKFIDLR